MTRYVGFLRGINVGGRNKVAMADLRGVCADLGHRDVRTYVQSGNVVFTATRGDTAALASELAERIDRNLGVSPSVLVRTSDELAAVVAANPYRAEADADPTKVHVAFLSAEPTEPSSLNLDPGDGPERLAAGDRVRYLLLPGGLGRSKLAADLTRRPAGVEVTVRNWRTVTTLLELAQTDDAEGGSRPS